MWSPKQLLSAVLLAGLGLALAGCGFRPMYGKSSTDPKVLQELATIQVKPIDDRAGQLLHNALLTQLNPKGEPVRPAYLLVVSLNSSDTAEATLLIAQGQSTKQASYDYLKQHYADISAQESVNKRAADQVAEDIRNQLAAYFIRAAEVHRGEVPVVR